MGILIFFHISRYSTLSLRFSRLLTWITYLLIYEYIGGVWNTRRSSWGILQFWHDA